MNIAALEQLHFNFCKGSLGIDHPKEKDHSTVE